MDIQITGLTKVTPPKVNGRGDTLHAYFSFKCDWLEIDGASLIEKGSGTGFTLYEPIEAIDKPFKRRVRMAGYMREAVAEAALIHYASMGGKL